MTPQILRFFFSVWKKRRPLGIHGGCLGAFFLFLNGAFLYVLRLLLVLLPQMGQEEVH